MSEQEKKNILHTELNTVFVYIFIFLIGIGIVYTMTTYINNQVNAFNEGIGITQNN